MLAPVTNLAIDSLNITDPTVPYPKKKREINMKIPENRIGLSTAGFTGNLVIAGVIFGFISPVVANTRISF